MYSPFRVFFNRAKKSKKGCTITLTDIRLQWEHQKGICPYTGWLLKLPPTTSSRYPKTPDRASLDRIDSKKGYTPDNIQFISLIAQYAKNDWSPNQVITFLEAAKNFSGAVDNR